MRVAINALMFLLLVTGGSCFGQSMVHSLTYNHFKDATLWPLSSDNSGAVTEVLLEMEGWVVLEGFTATDLWNDSYHGEPTYDIAEIRAGWQDPMDVLASGHSIFSAIDGRPYGRLRISGSKVISLVELSNNPLLGYWNHCPVALRYLHDGNASNPLNVDAGTLLVPDGVSASVRATRVESEDDIPWGVDDMLNGERQWVSAYYENNTSTERNVTVYWWNFTKTKWEVFGNATLQPAYAVTSGYRYAVMPLTNRIKAEGLPGDKKELVVKAVIWDTTPTVPDDYTIESEPTIE